MFECFVITLLKWMKYENRLTFAYYSITLWDFKSLHKVFQKNLTSVKNWKEIFLKMSKYRNTVFYDYQSRFLVIFSSNFPFTGKYYARSPPTPQEKVDPEKTFFSAFNLGNSWIPFLFRVFAFSKNSCSHPFFQRSRVNFNTTVSFIHPLKGCFSIIREHVQI